MEEGNPQRRPTEAELAILRVLWTHGPCTVREVQTELGPATGYTTALKLLQIMVEKGLVSRDEQQRAHVYRARLERERTERQLVGDLLTRAFGGSAKRMMMQLLDAGAATPGEIAEMRQLLDHYEKKETREGKRS